MLSGLYPVEAVKRRPMDRPLNILLEPLALPVERSNPRYPWDLFQQATLFAASKSGTPQLHFTSFAVFFFN
jgi:hypothetical protein